jgi:iron(III) transport system substrate-binding protein
MRLAQLAIVLALACILVVPLALRPASTGGNDQAETLIIVTPHVQQIRIEVGQAFERWMEREHKRLVRIDWRSPGGTSEILKLLEAQFTAAMGKGLIDAADPKNPAVAAGTIGYDLMFGGGSFDHGRLKNGVSGKINGEDRKVPMSIPAGLPQAQLDACFGENIIGTQTLYDPDQFWIGTALSSFGIIYNLDLLKDRGLGPPATFEDLADLRYDGLLSLADPRQSGSVTTTMDSILNFYGWEQGWRILRGMAANARSFSGSATKPPIDVSTGEAGAGLAIDFYGRVQAASVSGGQSSPRVGYVDPAGAVYIDADPVSILRGAPHPELARLFVEFCLTEEAQALWQFPATTTSRGQNNPRTPDGRLLGPLTHELHRLPIRQSLYAPEMKRAFTDDADPFAAASKVPSKRWRASIPLMIGASAIDVTEDQRAAWRTIRRVRDAGETERAETLERLFFSWPTPERVEARWSELFGSAPPAEALVPIEPGEKNATFDQLAKVWRDKDAGPKLRVVYTEVFREIYAEVIARAER